MCEYNVSLSKHDVTNKANFQSVCVDKGFKVEVSQFAPPIQKMFPFEAMLLFVLQLQEQIMPPFSVATPESKETKIPIYIRTEKSIFLTTLLLQCINSM